MHPELSKRLSRIQIEEALGKEGLFGGRVELEECSYPNLYVRFKSVDGLDRLLHFDLVNYDFQPVAIEAVDPVTRGPLDHSQRILRDGGEFPGHLLLGRPFLCVTGTRAFYMHEGHRPQVTGERWEARRADFRLVDLISYISDRFASGRWK